MSTLTSSRPDLVFAAINMNVDGRPLEVGFYTQPVPIDTRNLKPWLNRRSSGGGGVRSAGWCVSEWSPPSAPLFPFGLQGARFSGGGAQEPGFLPGGKARRALRVALTFIKQDDSPALWKETCKEGGGG